MRRWYEMRAAAAKAGRLQVDIYDTIDPYYGVTARQFRRDLNAAGDVDEIELHLHSRGGSVFEGLAIYATLVNHPAVVTVHVDGVAASIASVIAMAGDQVVMAENAFLMIHNPWAGVVGDSAELRKLADTLDKFKPALVRAYQRHAKMSADELAKAMDEETWYDAEEAIAAGLAHEIKGPIELAASVDLGAFERVPGSLAATARSCSVDDPVAEARRRNEELGECTDLPSSPRSTATPAGRPSR